MKYSNKINTIVFMFLVLLLSNNLFAQSSDKGSCETDVIGTTGGDICGMAVETSTGKNADAFLGIPFGESTAGKNRFKAPVPKEPWEGTLVADDYGIACPAPSIDLVDVIQSEDCLFLNIWRPEGTTSESNLPVMVWIFGGAFIRGNAQKPLYDGSYLSANEDVVIVNFNYRIGAFGFLATEELKGNYGIQDQQLALKWVQDNIKNFGGDPDKVTIFGESSGAMSVGIHLVSAPDSKDLFRAGIMESNPFSIQYKTTEEAEDLGLVFQAMVGCGDADCLREKTMKEILISEEFLETTKTTVFSGMQYYLTWTPTIDDVVLTKDPVLAFNDGDINKPMILGTNRDEGELFEGFARISMGHDTDDQFSYNGYISYASSIFGENILKILKQYPANNVDNEPVLAKIITDYVFSCANRNIAQAASASESPAYMYRFNHVASFNGLCLKECVENVCHEEEIVFIFHTIDKVNRCIFNKFLTGYRFTEEEELLSQSMGKYWTNFAKYLDPNGEGEDTADFRWEPFTDENPNYVTFDSFSIKTDKDPFEDTCELWDSLGYRLKNAWAE